MKAPRRISRFFFYLFTMRRITPAAPARAPPRPGEKKGRFFFFVPSLSLRFQEFLPVLFNKPGRLRKKRTKTEEGPTLCSRAMSTACPGQRPTPTRRMLSPARPTWPPFSSRSSALSSFSAPTSLTRVVEKEMDTWKHENPKRFFLAQRRAYGRYAVTQNVQLRGTPPEAGRRAPATQLQLSS